MSRAATTIDSMPWMCTVRLTETQSNTWVQSTRAEIKHDDSGELEHTEWERNGGERVKDRQKQIQQPSICSKLLFESKNNNEK